MLGFYFVAGRGVTSSLGSAPEIKLRLSALPVPLSAELSHQALFWPSETWSLSVTHVNVALICCRDWAYFDTCFLPSRITGVYHWLFIFIFNRKTLRWEKEVRGPEIR